MEETWKAIKGYEGLYEVSSTGKVRTLPHKTNGVSVPGVELKANMYKGHRYIRLRLYKNGVSKDYMLHRLVAQAFVPNPYNKPYINHIDGNRENNSASNLEWCTQAENNRHAIILGINSIEPMLKKTRKRVQQIGADGTVIKEWESMTEAASALNLQVSNISHCCKGRIKSTGGYKWRLALER